MGTRNIDELAGIQFSGPLGEAFFAYAQQLYVLGQRWSFELDMASAEVQASLEAMYGNPLLFGLNAKWKARRVAKRLKRAQEMAHGIAEEGRKFYQAYEKHILNQAR
ncbi:hypothetical protein [Actinomadura rudentiformis]|uniref:Uncharacterized protein n=1 Tax=Actinomadura rudentiformis TaxID=359158 RepID=A0A6H9YQF3_9ACTN|nr:hypothetical protein [Actinomadura rudentiformis]KAB2347378.1 hypothetical protein F8566_20410 [Actinomadura rudentiformis]